jgi:NADPH-ferrihemoprotein reductase
VSALLRWHCDLLSTPHKEALAALGRCATDAAHAARLKHLAAQEGKQDYTEWVAKPHRSLLEVRGAAWRYMGG